MHSRFDPMADRMREAIRGAPDTVASTAKGRIYYVSAQGSDENDGKSPECAWATLQKVGAAPFRAGDAVLFERGRVFRGQLLPADGVSYGAYGAGDKPCIYGSAMNMASAKWNEARPGLWVCETALPLDVGIVVFDHGAAVGVKRLEMDAVAEDFDFFHDSQDHKVYLRYAPGNPGTLFSSIEMGERRHIIPAAGLTDAVFENLCLQYGGAHGIGGTRMKNVTVRHCELGWIGGSLQYGVTRYGNAIENWEGCENFVIDGCYVYQVYDAGITHQGEAETTVNNTVFRNNLIEYCTYSIEYFQRNSGSMMSNITYEGNLLRFAGFGWGHQRPDKSQAAHIKSWRHPNPSTNFVIRNNILDCSRFHLLQIVAKAGTASLPAMADNTYAQPPGGMGGEWGGETVGFEGGAAPLRTLGMDKNPTVICE